MKLTLAYIKFVNGEKENPFECKDQNKIMLWNYERGCTFTKSEKFLIDEYRFYVKNFQEKMVSRGAFKNLSLFFHPSLSSGRKRRAFIMASHSCASDFRFVFRDMYLTSPSSLITQNKKRRKPGSNPFLAVPFSEARLCRF